MVLDPNLIQEDWAKRGFHGGLWIDPPGQCWENYIHKTDELLMLLEGKLELVVGKKTFEPKAGEEILIPANVTHSVRNIGKTTARWLYAYKE